MTCKTFTKRTICLLLTLALLGSLSLTAFADEGNLGSGTPDGTPPVLTGITLSATTVSAPNTIEVIVSATDDVSGVNYAELLYFCEETGKTIWGYAEGAYWDNDLGERVPWPDGKLHGRIEIDQYVESGTFVLGSIHLWDYADNIVGYREVPKDKFDQTFPDALGGRQFRVTDSGTPDGTAPVLKDLILSTTTMAAPGIIEVTVDATDDVSGVNYADLLYVCEETGKTIWGYAEGAYWDKDLGERVPWPDGKLHGRIEIDQYVESGTFVLEQMYIGDNAGNSVRYLAESEYDEPSFPDTVGGRQFNVLNAIPDVSTSVSKSEFVDQIKDAKDDAYIVADYSGEATLPETAFDAISGTDKTLDLVSEGVTWRFNGNDIVNDAKPIDLNVEITKVEENDSAPAQEIQEKLEENPGVVMKFAENGELPGKATIQVKVDYAMREYLGSSDKLCVYYYNNQTGQLELVAENLVVINDTYVEFSITHCSYYVLTAKTVDNDAEPDPVSGDADGDGEVTNVDAMLILQYYVGLISDNALVLAVCDVDGNGEITNVDAMMVLQYYVGLLPELG